MPIRVQCDNCGKVYNLPDESAGKRLRCKQCAVAFTVPTAIAAAAPTVSVSVPAAQKICVVCGQDVAGKPRTKDQAGNYYCRACYEEKSRAREQLAASRVGAAVPAGVGGGEGDMIDLAALEQAEATEQLDYSAQPPPPPIPDMDFVALPIPDMEQPIMAEPVVIEAPKPKKKKKKKPAAAAKAASGDSILSKMMALPIELWIIGISLIVGGAGMISSTLAGFAFLGLVLIGVGCLLWGKICIVMAAFAEGTMTGIMYLFVPFYWLIFLLSNWADLQRYVLRTVLGIAIIIGGAIMMSKHGNEGDEDELPRVSSRSRATSRDDAAAANNETSAPGNQTPAANSQTPATNPAPGAAETPAEEAIRVGVRFTQMLSNGQSIDFYFGDPDEIDKRKDDIEEVIRTSLAQRGIKPPEGQYYGIEAMVEESLSSVQKIKLANGDEVPAPMLICKMRVRDSVGRGKYIFAEARNIELPAEVIAKASKSKLRSVIHVEFINKALWKNVTREFKALADQFKPEAAAAPAGANAPGKTAAPTQTAAPAK